MIIETLTRCQMSEEKRKTFTEALGLEPFYPNLERVPLSDLLDKQVLITDASLDTLDTPLSVAQLEPLIGSYPLPVSGESWA